MKSREWYEDSIQTILCECLPQLPKSNIRPAYQKTKQTNPFAVNHMDVSDPMKDGVKGAKNSTNIIYFWLHFDPLDLLATEISDRVSTVVPFKLTVSVYGRDSMPIAVRLRAFLRTEGVLFRMLGMQSVMRTEPRMTTFPEEHNGEWWERTDVDFNIDTLVDDFVGGEEAADGGFGDGQGYSKSTDGQIVVEEVSDGNKRLS